MSRREEALETLTHIYNCRNWEDLPLFYAKVSYIVTREELADHWNVSRTTVNKLMNGQIHNHKRRANEKSKSAPLRLFGT